MICVPGRNRTCNLAAYIRLLYLYAVDLHEAFSSYSYYPLRYFSWNVTSEVWFYYSSFLTLYLYTFNNILHVRITVNVHLIWLLKRERDMCLSGNQTSDFCLSRLPQSNNFVQRVPFPILLINFNLTSLTWISIFHKKKYVNLRIAFFNFILLYISDHTLFFTQYYASVLPNLVLHL